MVDHFIPLPKGSEEWQLYQDIEEYLRTFFRQEDGGQKGLGFVMTIYRRRLTSSIHAIRESLKRRRAELLSENPRVMAGIDDDDRDEDLFAGD
ncbi:MAG: hypothetical protein C4541_12810, partial [Candidatus Auribacter fodinae]